MSNGIYDILGKLNGLQPKDNPVSMSAEPVYESIDTQDITTNVDSLEEKYQNFLIEETAKKSQAQKDADISRGEPEIIKLLNKARLERPAAASDTEALAYQMVKATKELEKEKAANDEQEKKIDDLQAKVGAVPTAQPAVEPTVIKPTPSAIPPVAQTPAPAQVQAEPTVDRLPTLAREPAVVTAPAQKSADVINFPKTAAQTRTTYKPAGNKKQSVGGKVAPSDVVIPDETIPDEVAQARAARAAKLKPADVSGFIPVGQVVGQQFDTKQENKLMKDMLKESIEMLREYKEGSPELGIYNYNDMLKKFQSGQQRVTLNFGIGKPPLTLYDYQAYGILAVLGSDQNQERKVQNIETTMSNYDAVVQLLMTPRVKKYISLFPEFASKSPVFKARARDVENNKFKLEPTTKKDPGEIPQQPHPYQQGDNQLEENSGNDTMQENVKTSSILKAVHQVEDKKLRESAKPDFLDLDKDGDTEESMKKAAKDAKEHEPDAPDESAVAKRKRLQALKDKQEDERAERGDDYKSATRVVKGRAYGGSAQKDDEEKDELEENLSKYPTTKLKAAAGKDRDADAKSAIPANIPTAKINAELKKRKELDEGKMKDIHYDLMRLADKKGYSNHKQFTPADYDELAKPHGISGKELAVALGHKKASQVAEVAPPGAKAERMVKHIKKGYSKDGNLTKREKGIAYATAWKAHNKGQVEEGTNFGDTIKNSEGKMTKVKVTEGKDAIRNHPIYTTKEAWDHYAQELAEQETMDEAVLAPVVDVQQELDEIAALAGLPPKMESKCSSCGCADCKCGTLDEAATRKDFRQVADLIKQIPDANKRKELAHHHSGIFKQQNPRFKHDVFCKACGVDECDYNMGAQPAAVIVGEMDAGFAEGEMDEGNEFTKARLDAIAQGADTFTVGGKTHNVTGDTSDEKSQVEESKKTVTEDINVNITANGEQDALNLLRKLSGMAEVPQVTGVAIPMGEEQATCEACGMIPCGCEEAVEEERDIELANTPHEEVAPISAVTTDAGGGLGGVKKQYPLAANRGANPLEEQVEESIWAAYESMINDVKA